MAEVSKSLSPLDGTGLLNLNEKINLNSISAAKISAMLPTLNGTSALNTGNIVQLRHHVNGNCNLAGVHLVVLAYPLTSIHMAH
jgi:hypothetical protein